MLLIRGLGAKGMAGGANADQRFSRSEVGTHDCELFLQRRLTTYADDQQVRGGQRSESWEIIRRLGVRDGGYAVEPGWRQLAGRKFRQRGVGLVFRLADHEQRGGRRCVTGMHTDGHQHEQTDLEST